MHEEQGEEELRENNTIVPDTQEAKILQECVLQAKIPVKQALNGPEADEWFEAMASEIISILENYTWDLIDRQKDQDVIGCRMILRNKYSSSGRLEKRKARLVTQGFTQEYGIHFDQTFAPVARLGSVRLLAALAAHNDMIINHFDVTSAYLNGDLDETIYMKVPKRFNEILEYILKERAIDKDMTLKCKKMISQLREGNKVCKLKKILVWT